MGLETGHTAEGASNGDDEGLREVKLVKDEELVQGVEHQGHDDDPGEVLHRLTKELGTTGGVGENGPQESGLPFAGVFQAAPESEQRDDGGHHQKAEVQRADGASEQLFKAVGEGLQGCVSSVFVPENEKASRAKILIFITSNKMETTLFFVPNLNKSVVQKSR